ncbi:MAG: ATP-binding cassette domain-containing protein, partial [Ruminiclostridium sp.]
AKKAGIALIPEDRRSEGIVNDMSIKENISLAFTSKWAKRGFINKSKENDEASNMVKSLNIVSTGINQLVKTLSGGNQQKVIIARWLIGNSEIFMFDQPTTGVDVGAKVEIYKQITDLAKKGATILLISSDFEELIGMSDRILVMSSGKIVKSFNYGEATETDILYWATSGS